MPSPRVAVVGPGAIGAVFAAAAYEAGHKDLVLCARRSLAEVVVTRDHAPPLVVEAPVLTDPGALEGPADWVLLAVKTYQTESAGPWLRALAGPGTVVVVLQNGVDHQARVAPLSGSASVLPAIVWCPAEASSPGHVRLRGEPRLTVPSGPEGEALAGLLEGAARIDRSDDFTTDAWRKLCLNSTSALMALTGRRAGVFRDPEVAALARALALECLAVARAEGAELEDSFADALLRDVVAKPADLGSSILYDREAGRPLEWDARNGVIRRLGARHGIPTPVSDVIVPLLAATNSGRSGGLDAR